MLPPNHYTTNRECCVWRCIIRKLPCLSNPPSVTIAVGVVDLFTSSLCAPFLPAKTTLIWYHNRYTQNMHNRDAHAGDKRVCSWRVWLLVDGAVYLVRDHSKVWNIVLWRNSCWSINMTLNHLRKALCCNCIECRSIRFSIIVAVFTFTKRLL